MKLKIKNHCLQQNTQKWVGLNRFLIYKLVIIKIIMANAKNPGLETLKILRRKRKELK